MSVPGQSIDVQKPVRTQAQSAIIGIGENAAPVREKVVSYLGYLGITLDEGANAKRGKDMVISTPESATKVLVIPTNEELMIARATMER